MRGILDKFKFKLKFASEQISRTDETYYILPFTFA